MLFQRFKQLPKKWMISIIAGALAVIMIITTLLMSWLEPKSIMIHVPTFTEKAETPAQSTLQIDPASIEENARALLNAKYLENKLNREYEYAMKAIEEERYTDAVEPIKSILEELSEDSEVAPNLRSTLANIYYATGQYDDCRRTCLDIVRRKEDINGTYSFLEGVCSLQAEEYEKAISPLEKALEDGFSDQPICHMQLMLCYFKLEDFDKVLFENEILQNPELTVEEDYKIAGYYLSGLSLIQTKDYKKATDYWNELLLLKEEGEYYYYRGLTYMAREQYKKGFADYKKALDLGYTTIECYYNLGICALGVEDAKTAKNCFTTVVQIGNDSEYVTMASGLLKELEKLEQ